MLLDSSFAVSTSGPGPTSPGRRLHERAGNIGIVTASSDPAEVVQVADRIVVVAGGDVTGELSVAEVTRRELSGLMAIERAARQVDGSIGSTRVKRTLAWVAYRYGLLVVLVGLLVFFSCPTPLPIRRTTA